MPFKATQKVILCTSDLFEILHKCVANCPACYGLFLGSHSCCWRTALHTCSSSNCRRFQTSNKQTCDLHDRYAAGNILSKQSSNGKHVRRAPFASVWRSNLPRETFAMIRLCLIKNPDWLISRAISRREIGWWVRTRSLLWIHKLTWHAEQVYKVSHPYGHEVIFYTTVFLIWDSSGFENSLSIRNPWILPRRPTGPKNSTESAWMRQKWSKICENWTKSKSKGRIEDKSTLVPFLMSL